MKRSEKQLPSKTDFTNCLPLNCSNFKSKQCESPYSDLICQQNKFEEVWEKLESKKKFPETITHKISETNSTFHVKWRTAGKV